MDSEKVFIEIPNELEVREEIREIIDKGLMKEKKSNLRRNVLAAAASVFVSLLVLGFVFPGYASQIPLIGRIFEVFETNYRDYSPLQEFAHDVSITGETHGMSITIEETVFDGQTVYFTYRVESDWALDDDFHFQISPAAAALWVDGVDMNEHGGLSASPGVLQQVSEYHYIAVGSVSFPNFDEIVEHAEVSFTLGDWYVRFPVERTAGDIIQINETMRNENFEATITQVIISPIGVKVYYNYTKPIEYAWLGWEFFTSSPVPEGAEANFVIEVSDDLGNEYAWDSLSEGHDDGGSGWLNLIEPLYPEASELIITLSMWVDYWDLGDWRHTGSGGVGYEEVIAGGGSVERREVILGEIVVPLP